MISNFGGESNILYNSKLSKHSTSHVACIMSIKIRRAVHHIGVGGAIPLTLGSFLRAPNTSSHDICYWTLLLAATGLGPAINLCIGRPFGNA